MPRGPGDRLTKGRRTVRNRRTQRLIVAVIGVLIIAAVILGSVPGIW